MTQYVLGVDGGNTKTDYFLFDLDGNLIDHVRSGTCSHEQFTESYEGSYCAMKEVIEPLLKAYSLTPKQIKAAAFGLAGVDISRQRVALEEVIKRFGFEKFVVDNDSFLGIKAAIPKGYGVCSINGTGTVAGGIDEKGARLQIGGIGDISGDEAGGAFIARKVIRAAYDELYRCSMKTSMTSYVMNELGISDPSLFIEAVSDLYKTRFSHTPYVQIVFDCAQSGDQIACELLENVALQLAKSAAGCINHLQFSEKVEVVLAGSVYVKPQNDILRDYVLQYLKQFSNLPVHPILLTLPPATGAILWALELAYQSPVNAQIREQVIKEVEALNL